MKTYAQFENDTTEQALKDNSGLTRKEYLEAYPAGSRKDEYWQELEAYLASNPGAKLSLPVCRSIQNTFGGAALLQLKKFFRCIPENVLLETGKTVSHS